MKRIYIIGAGPFGRELLGWFNKDSNYANQYSFSGFLDNRENLLDKHTCDYNIVGDPFNFSFLNFCFLVPSLIQSFLLKILWGGILIFF